MTGPAEASTSTGTIRFGTIDGPGTVKTSTGSIGIGEATGDLDLKTGTGHIDIDRVRPASPRSPRTAGSGSVLR